VDNQVVAAGSSFTSTEASGSLEVHADGAKVTISAFNGHVRIIWHPSPSAVRCCPATRPTCKPARAQRADVPMQLSAPAAASRRSPWHAPRPDSTLSHRSLPPPLARQTSAHINQTSTQAAATP
jgi:hypothetical protein